MTGFYNTVNDRELTRVEELLKNEGIEFTLRAFGKDTVVKEILVAEEDLVFADKLICENASLLR